MADEQKKDTWAKIGILLQSGGGLLTAVTVAALGFITSNYLKEREIAETASRLSSQRDGGMKADGEVCESRGRLACRGLG